MGAWIQYVRRPKESGKSRPKADFVDFLRAKPGLGCTSGVRVRGAADALDAGHHRAIAIALLENERGARTGRVHHRPLGQPGFGRLDTKSALKDTGSARVKRHIEVLWRLDSR